MNVELDSFQNPNLEFLRGCNDRRRHLENRTRKEFEAQSVRTLRFINQAAVLSWVACLKCKRGHARKEWKKLSSPSHQRRTKIYSMPHTPSKSGWTFKRPGLPPNNSATSHQLCRQNPAKWEAETAWLAEHRLCTWEVWVRFPAPDGAWSTIRRDSESELGGGSLNPKPKLIK